MREIRLRLRAAWLALLGRDFHGVFRNMGRQFARIAARAEKRRRA